MSVVIYSDAIPDDVELDMEHMSEDEAQDREIDWEECEVNYRLNHCDSILYAVLGKSVVGHLGIKGDSVETVFVESSYRGDGIGISLYEAAFAELKGLKSSHINAMESGAKGVWRSLKKKYPGQVEFDKDEEC